MESPSLLVGFPRALNQATDHRLNQIPPNGVVQKWQGAPTFEGGLHSSMRKMMINHDKPAKPRAIPGFPKIFSSPRRPRCAGGLRQPLRCHRPKGPRPALPKLGRCWRRLPRWSECLGTSKELWLRCNCQHAAFMMYLDIS